MSMLRKERLAQVSILVFGLLSIWWLSIFLRGIKGLPENDWFGFVYGGFSIWGGILGLNIAQKWGGMKSLIGRAILSLSSGLLLQAFGQYSFWFINVFEKIEVPYPGIPDIGFFGSIPCYIYAGILLAKAAGAKASLKTFSNKAQIIIIPLVMLFLSYLLFLRNYSLDLSKLLETFLNFGYPMGQLIYISVAVLTYTLSRKLLGGVMRFPILFLIVAFVAQFISDYSFIYFQDVFFAGSFVDYFYLVAYFLMTLGLIQVKTVLNKLD